VRLVVPQRGGEWHCNGKFNSPEQPLYWQYDRALGWAKVAMRDGDWKILADAGLKRFELYDIQHDISEKTNVSQQQPERLASMAATLKRIHAEVKAEGPTWPSVKKPAKGEKD
jgi:arylsulfatase A